MPTRTKVTLSLPPWQLSHLCCQRGEFTPSSVIHPQRTQDQTSAPVFCCQMRKNGFQRLGYVQDTLKEAAEPLPTLRLQRLTLAISPAPHGPVQEGASRKASLHFAHGVKRDVETGGLFASTVLCPEPVPCPDDLLFSIAARGQRSPNVTSSGKGSSWVGHCSVGLRPESYSLSQNPGCEGHGG